MRRSKIRPSINLAASRRSTKTAPVNNKVKEKKSPANDTPTQPPIPAKEIRTTASPKVKIAPAVSSPLLPVVGRPESPKPDLQPAVPERSGTTQVQEEAKSVEPTPEISDLAVTEKPPPASNQATESIAAPSQAKEVTNPQRRRKFSAKPNLGQHRMRLPLPSRRKSETVQEKSSNVDSPDNRTPGDVVKPLEPPPVRRVVESIKNTEVMRTTTTVNPVQSNIRELTSTSTQPTHQPSKPTVHPKTVQQMSRPERLVEKRAALPPTMQDKRIRDLKALEAETPAKRRKRYIKKSTPPDRSKMTMSDLIYYNPKANPMKSVIVEKERVKPINENNNSLKDNASPVNEDAEEDEEETETNQMAPQVRIDADGKIVIDKESLTIEASPARTFVAENAEVVHEDSSNVTYASFRKRIHTTAWSKIETERFYMALSMVGTDFTMMNVLFPKRTRHQIKNKFKREERNNRLRIDTAIKEKMPLDKTLFETGDSDEENIEEENKNTKTKAKKQGAKQKNAASKNAVENEEPELIEDMLDSDPEDGGNEVDVTNILARPTRSGRIPKVRVNYNSADIDDDVVTDGGIVRHIGSPIINIQRTPSGSVVPPGGITPSRITPSKGTPTTPMQTVYVVTPLQGGKQFMIREHSIPQLSPDTTLPQQTAPSQFPSYGASTVQQSPVIQLQTTPQQQLSQTPLHSTTMQLRMPSPQNPLTSPTGSHTVLTQRIGNTKIIVVSPATRGQVSPGQVGVGQVGVQHPSTGLQTTPIQSHGAVVQNQTTPQTVSCQNVGNQRRTFIRIQPGDVSTSPNNNNNMIPVNALPQQNQLPRQTAKNKQKSNRTVELSLDEPFIPPSMKSKPSPSEGASSINNQQKVIVQSLPQSVNYSGDSLPINQEVLLMDDVSLAAQTEVVSDVAMEVECAN